MNTLEVNVVDGEGAVRMPLVMEHTGWRVATRPKVMPRPHQCAICGVIAMISTNHTMGGFVHRCPNWSHHGGVRQDRFDYYTGPTEEVEAEFYTEGGGGDIGQAMVYVWDLLTGRHSESQQVHRLPFRDLRIRSDHQLFLQMDGEPIDPTDEVEIRILPKVLRVLVTPLASENLFQEPPETPDNALK